jgi:hypothetical protein
MRPLARTRCTLRQLAGGPLVRFVDRVEAWAALTAVVLLIVAAFFAAQVSESIRADQLRTAEVEASQRHLVEAVALDRSRVKPQRALTTFTVPVQWFAHGVTRNTVVEMPRPVMAGDRVGIWTDSRGNAVSAPRTSADARANAVGAAIGFWLLGFSMVTGVGLVLRRAFNRVRHRAWDRDLELLVGNGGGSTANNP